MSTIPHSAAPVAPDSLPVPNPFSPDFPGHYPDEAPELSIGADFVPSEEDEDWLAGQDQDGGCDPSELTPAEIAQHAGTVSAFDYWVERLDPTDVMEQLEHEARAALGLLF